MTPQQIQQAEIRLMQWRASHSDPDSRREAYRKKILAFTLDSMAMENEPVNPERVDWLCLRFSRPTPFDNTCG